MADKQELINVYSTQKCLEVLGICRNTFYDKYKKRLTKLPKQGRSNFFLENEVLLLQEEINKNRNMMKSLGFNVVN